MPQKYKYLDSCQKLLTAGAAKMHHKHILKTILGQVLTLEAPLACKLNSSETRPFTRI